MTPRSALTKFERHIREGESGCWEWSGTTNRPTGGYATFRLPGSKNRVYVHRWSYEFHIAPIPDGLQIDHLCRNTLCVNPWHLEPVTPQVNQNRIPTSSTCRRGHPFSSENTYAWGQRRFCKTCRLDAQRERSRRRAGTRGAT